MSQILRVALDTPLRRLFDYLPKAAAGGEEVPPGSRVRVPFGRRRAVGIVMGTGASSQVPSARLKSILEVLDTSPLLDAPALALVEWAAEYYHHPLGEVLASALPRALRLGAPALACEERWAVSAAGVEAAARGEPRRAPRQRALLELLARQPGASAAFLDEHARPWREAARALAARGLVARTETAVARTSVPATTRTPGPELLPEQSAAVAAVGASLGSFAAFVLHGITGSGKTEVYLRLVERVLAAGKSALVLVPEIGLTPQLLGRFRERFAAPLAVLHSALTDAERLAAWRDACSGQARIVLGTRSAVFAPVPELGLIVVDEEHDPSFKQHEGGFRYSARDLAVVRARHAAVPVVLGSATPSLETLHNVAAQRYRLLRLPTAGRGGTAAGAEAGGPARQRAARRYLHARGARDRATPGRRRPGAGVPQPPRLCADAAVHRLRLDRAVPRVRRAAHGAPCRAAPALPSLRRRCAAAAALSAVRLRRQAGRPGHRAHRRDARDAVPRRGDVRGSIATWCAGAATSRRSCGAWPAETRAFSSARRW